MFQAPSLAPNPVLLVMESRAQAQGAKLLPSGVYRVGSFQVVLERSAPTSPMSPPTLSNHRVVPCGGGLFSEVGRRFGVLSTVAALSSLLAGRVYAAKEWEGQLPFLIDPSAPMAKLHIPGVELVQELPLAQLWQWLELMTRAQLLPYDGQAVYQAPGPLARMVGAKPSRDGLASEWVGILRRQHVSLLAKTGEARLQWLDPQPTLLQGGATG